MEENILLKNSQGGIKICKKHQPKISKDSEEVKITVCGKCGKFLSLSLSMAEFPIAKSHKEKKKNESNFSRRSKKQTRN